MKAGDEKVVGGKILVWVICPNCDTGRWAQKCRAGRPSFTGQCRDCYMEIAKQEMGRYFPGSQGRLIDVTSVIREGGKYAEN